MHQTMNFLSRFWQRLHAPRAAPVPVDKAITAQVDPEPVFVATEDEASIGRFVVMRDAVLNRAMTVTGYSFAQADVTTPTRFGLERDRALVQYVCGEQARKMVGDRISLVSIGQGFLTDPMLEFLGLAKTTPLVRASSLPEGEAWPIERLAALKQAGMPVGIDDGRLLLENDALANTLGMAFLTVSEILPPDLLQISRQLSRLYPDLKLGVRGLETQEEFDACCRLGFVFFQGPFIRRREQWAPSQISPSALRICDLLVRMRKGAELDEIAEEARLDPMISYRILRLANSVAAGAAQPVTSVRDAVLINGRDALYRWLVMLLCSSAPDTPTQQAVVEIALTRGRLMELLAGPESTPAMRQELFLTGMLSLLDVMLKVPMDSLVAQLTPPAAVTDAILKRAGPCALPLQLAEACDQGDEPRVVQLCAMLDIPADALNQMLADASAWARESIQSI
jgi:EAL and modified HD-GYP domain-containing signal transduction protein